MRGLRYELSIPGYLLSKLYHQFGGNKLSPIFPNLHYKRNLPEPTLNGSRWILLKSLMSGICGSDLNMLRGFESYSMEPYASFPAILGHENVSEVIEVGSDVTRVKVGDRVVINPVMGCQVHERKPMCPNCQNGMDALCEHFAENNGLGAGMSLGYHQATGGGWSEFYQAHEWQAYRISHEIPLKRAVLADPLACALQAVATHAQGLKTEKSVLIYGAGTMGLLTITAIRMLELPWRVIVGYRYSFQEKLAKELGADVVLHTGREFYQKLATETGGEIRAVTLGKPVFEGGVDTVFDCVGSSSSIDDSLRFCLSRGSVILVATANRLDKIDAAPLWFREIKLLGTCMSMQVVDPRDQEKKQAYQIVSEALTQLNIEKLVTHTFDIGDYKQALRTAMNKGKENVVKVVLAF